MRLVPVLLLEPGSLFLGQVHCSGHWRLHHVFNRVLDIVVALLAGVWRARVSPWKTGQLNGIGLRGLARVRLAKLPCGELGRLKMEVLVRLAGEAALPSSRSEHLVSRPVISAQHVSSLRIAVVLVKHPTGATTPRGSSKQAAHAGLRLLSASCLLLLPPLGLEVRKLLIRCINGVDMATDVVVVNLLEVPHESLLSGKLVVQLVLELGLQGLGRALQVIESLLLSHAL